MKEMKCAIPEYAVPEYATAEDIKRVRKKLGLTQKDFAVLVGSSKPTIERWESGKSAVTGPIVLLLYMLELNPTFVETIKVPKKDYPVRLWYMHKQAVCTLIEINEMKREIRIRNYTDHIMFRAFGVNEHPTYEEYLEFLESRCFPEGRDKMKLVLKDLDLPFYDPFMIIEKTDGRMAEDDFWIRIER